jgi:hypothetical protein
MTPPRAGVNSYTFNDSSGSADAAITAAHDAVVSMTPAELAESFLEATTAMASDPAMAAARLAAVRLAALATGVAA